MLQATRNDGLLQECGTTPSGGLVFDNSGFVETIASDPSPLGSMMSSLHPSALTIYVMKPPESWRRWEPVVSPDAASLMLDAFPEEIPNDLRLTKTRRELSARSGEILRNADMSVSTRGINDESVPVSATSALAGLVYQAYYLIERNTTASLKSEEAKLSTLRREKFSSVARILDNHEDILGVTLLSTYTEPSMTMIRRFYYLAAIVGVTEAHTMLNSLYENHCEAQRESVLSAARSAI